MAGEYKLSKSERDELKKRVLTVSELSLSCLNVLDTYYTGQRKNSGDSVFFECPNGCRGKHVTSCSIPKSRAYMYKCFKCDQGGNAIKLRSILEGREYFDVAIEEAYAHNVINEKEYNYLCFRPVSEKRQETPKKVTATIEQSVEEEPVLAEPELLHFVYSNLLSLPQFSLTEKARQYLEGRGVTDFSGFFCHHDDFDMKEFVKGLCFKNPNFNHRDLYGVPGFFFKFKDEEKKQGSWRFLKKAPDSIIIAVKNANGYIVGLQVRNIVEKGSRYYWLSSLSESNKDGCGYGSSPGSPVHVEYPDVIKSGYYVFTEGFFKVKKLVSIFKGVGFSLQGMQNSKLLASEVKMSARSPIVKNKMDMDEDKKKVTFNFFFDADMIYKYQVYQAAKKSFSLLREQFPNTPARFHVWRAKEGKGFDDLLENYPEWKEHLTCIKAEVFIEVMDELIEETRKLFGDKSLAEIHKDDKDARTFKETLYNAFWDRVSK